MAGPASTGGVRASATTKAGALLFFPIMSAPVETFRTSDGARIGFRFFGKEHKTPALVMINGMSAVMDDWVPLAEAFAQTRPVLIFDHRGIGDSYLTEEGAEDITIELMAQDVIDLVRSLHMHTIHLLGFSMGGLIAQAILTHSDAKATTDQAGVRVQGVEVRRAVLTATFAKMPKGEFHPSNIPVPPPGSSKAERDYAVVKYMLEMQYHPSVLGPHGALQHTFDRRMAHHPHTRRPQMIIGYQAASMAMYDGKDKLCHIPSKLPMIVIHGRYDRMVNYDESNDLQKRLPQLRRLRPDVEGDREAFGHMWFDYFDLQASWVDPITQFLDTPRAAHM